MRCISPMEYQWNKCYSIGTNRTNGRVECTPLNRMPTEIFYVPVMRCISPMEYQWNNCYSIGTNRTNARVGCTATQPEANRNILTPCNEKHFTNAINVIPLVPIVPMDEQNASSLNLKSTEIF